MSSIPSLPRADILGALCENRFYAVFRCDRQPASTLARALEQHASDRVFLSFFSTLLPIAALITTFAILFLNFLAPSPLTVSA